MIKDKAKIKAVLSVVALSVHLGLNADVVGRQPAGVSPVEAMEKKEHKSMSVRSFGNVRGSSIVKAREILDSFLSDKVKDTLDKSSYITVVEDSKMEEYSKNKLNIDIGGIQDGTKISDAEGIQIYCPESMVEDFLPAVAMSINTKFE